MEILREEEASQNVVAPFEVKAGPKTYPVRSADRFLTAFVLNINVRVRPRRRRDLGPDSVAQSAESLPVTSFAKWGTHYLERT